MTSCLHPKCSHLHKNNIPCYHSSESPYSTHSNRVYTIKKDRGVSSMSSKKRYRINNDKVSNMRNAKSPTNSSISSYEIDISNHRLRFHPNSYPVRQPLIYSQIPTHGFQNFKFNMPIIPHDNKMINFNSNFKKINKGSNRDRSNFYSQIPLSKKIIILLQLVSMMLMFQSVVDIFIPVSIQVDIMHPTATS